MQDIDKKSDKAAGSNRSPGISWPDLMKTDARPVPNFLAKESYTYRGSEPLAAGRYTSAEFKKLEDEKLWPNVWQFAAREEDMPGTGDYIVYENAGRSYIVSRQDDGSVRAFHNVCLHRGRKLRTKDGTADQFQCPFHGFTWNKNGSLKQIPCRWDFGHLDDKKMTLPEAQVSRWGGYIFVRENWQGPGLEEYLAPLPEHFKRWRHEECSTAIWVGKVVPANWKVTMEAFMEAWHTVVTHPQLLPFTRLTFTLSPQVNATGKPQQWIVDEFIKFNGRSAENYDDAGDAFSVKVPDGVTARRALGQAMRENYTKTFGHDHSQATDAELLDGLVYNVFPNFSPWGGYMPNIVYRWRPWHDQDHCLMEVRILTRVPPGAAIPHSVPMKFLSDSQPWTDAPELGVLGSVFEQDMQNLPFVQEGLKASKNGQINLGNYQEIRIRQFHQTIDKYLKA